MNVTRRGFIKGMGAVAGASGVSFSLPTIVRAAEKAEASAVAKSALGDQVVKSTCVHCVNFCGIEARVSDGVIRAIYPDKARADYYNWGICPTRRCAATRRNWPTRMCPPPPSTTPPSPSKERS